MLHARKQRGFVQPYSPCVPALCEAKHSFARRAVACATPLDLAGVSAAGGVQLDADIYIRRMADSGTPRTVRHLVSSVGAAGHPCGAELCVPKNISADNVNMSRVTSALQRPSRPFAASYTLYVRFLEIPVMGQ